MDLPLEVIVEEIAAPHTFGRCDIISLTPTETSHINIRPDAIRRPVARLLAMTCRAFNGAIRRRWADTPPWLRGDPRAGVVCAWLSWLVAHRTIEKKHFDLSGPVPRLCTTFLGWWHRLNIHAMHAIGPSDVMRCLVGCALSYQAAPQMRVLLALPNMRELVIPFHASHFLTETPPPWLAPASPDWIVAPRVCRWATLLARTPRDVVISGASVDDDTPLLLACLNGRAAMLAAIAPIDPEDGGALTGKEWKYLFASPHRTMQSCIELARIMGPPKTASEIIYVTLGAWHTNNRPPMRPLSAGELAWLVAHVQSDDAAEISHLRSICTAAFLTDVDTIRWAMRQPPAVQERLRCTRLDSKCILIIGRWDTSTISPDLLTPDELTWLYGMILADDFREWVHGRLFEITDRERMARAIQLLEKQVPLLTPVRDSLFLETHELTHAESIDQLRKVATHYVGYARGVRPLLEHAAKLANLDSIARHRDVLRSGVFRQQTPTETWMGILQDAVSEEDRQAILAAFKSNRRGPSMLETPSALYHRRIQIDLPSSSAPMETTVRVPNDRRGDRAIKPVAACIVGGLGLAWPPPSDATCSCCQLRPGIRRHVFLIEVKHSHVGVAYVCNARECLDTKRWQGWLDVDDH